MIFLTEENLPARIAVTDTPLSLNDGTDGHEMESPTTGYMGETIPQRLEKTSSNQKANQGLGSEGVESNDTIKMDDPIALRTRRRTKLQHPSKAKRAKNIPGKSKGTEEKSLLLQLIQQNKRQQDRITELNLMLKKVLELQLSMLHELHEDIEAVLQCSEKTLQLPGPIMVKPPRANERKARSKRLISAPASEDCECGPRSNHAIKMQSSTTSSVIDSTKYADRECGPGSISGKTVSAVPVTYGKNASFGSGNDESTCDRAMHRNIKTILPTSAALDDSDASSCYGARVFMAKATPRKTTKDASDSLDDSSNYESTRHSDVNDVSQTNDASPDSVRSDASPILATSARNEKPLFICPKERKKDRDEAYERIRNALDQVPDTVHFDKAGKRKTATLYVGNLQFKASVEDLSNALNRIFKRIQVEKVTIPQRNEKSLGYAFIELSWAAGAPVKMFDICVTHSAMVFVNSRPIYFRELNDKGTTTTQAYATTPPRESTAKVFKATTTRITDSPDSPDSPFDMNCIVWPKGWR